MSKADWVDFKKLKERVSFDWVVERYGLEMKREKGGELIGRCPFHAEKKPSFRVNTAKGVFHCFGCGAKGNILDFVARKEGVSIRDAALKMAEWFPVGELAGESPEAKGETDKTKPERKPEKGPEQRAGEDERNKPLTFTLKNLDPDHEYIKGRGVDGELARLFGIGYCNKGLMAGRIAIPIHDEKGQLVAYAGRWPGDDLPEGESKYKLPAGFKKNLVLYNLNRVAGAEHLVVVEGFFDCMAVHKAGFLAVALVGTTLSAEQETLLVEAGIRRVTLFLDGDAAGLLATNELLPRLSRRFWTKAVCLQDGQEPDTVGGDGLRELLGDATR